MLIAPITYEINLLSVKVPNKQNKVSVNTSRIVHSSNFPIDSNKKLKNAILKNISFKKAPTNTEKEELLYILTKAFDSRKLKNFLLKHKPYVDVPLDDGLDQYSILHYIARDNRVAVLEYIKNNYSDFNVNIQEYDGWTPLHMAAYNNNINIVNHLLKIEGINVKIKNDNGKTAKDLAREEGYSKIVKMLEEAEVVNKGKENLIKSFDIDNLSPENNIYTKEEINQQFQALLASEKYDKAIEMLEKTPFLDFEAEENALLKKVVKIANIELLDKVYDYRLNKQQAMLQDYEIKEKEFLEKTIIELSYSDLKNNSFALKTVEALKYIVNNKEFNPNDMVKNKSLFEIVCEIDSEGVLVKQILSKFDDVFTQKAKKTTTNKKIKELIKEYESVGKYKVKLDKIKRLLLTSSTREVGINQIKDFVESASFNLDVSDSIGNSMLHIVSTVPEDSARGIIQKLIDKGIDINKKNMTKQNALISAIKTLITSKNEAESTAILSNIKFLIDKGISIDDQDQLGQSAFHYACMTTSAALLMLLLTKNPNILIKDIKGNRAVKYLKTDEMKKIYEEFTKI